MTLDIIAIMLFCFLAGYILGKKHGLKQGFQEGRAVTPLIIREASLTNGQCSVCKTVLGQTKAGTTDDI